MNGKTKNNGLIAFIAIAIALLAMNHFGLLGVVIPNVGSDYAYRTDLTNGANMARLYSMTLLCDKTGNDIRWSSLSFQGGGTNLGIPVIGQLITYTVTQNAADPYISSLTCDGTAYWDRQYGDDLTIYENGVSFCRKDFSNIDTCTGKRLTKGYVYKYEASVSGNGYCYVNINGQYTYLYAYAADGTYRKQLSGTQLCQSQDWLYNLQTSQITGWSNSSTPVARNVNLQIGQSFSVPYYYMQVATISPYSTSSGLLIDCRQDTKQVTGYAKITALDGSKWVIPDSSKVVVQGTDSSKNNYAQRFACIQDVCVNVYNLPSTGFMWDDNTFDCVPKGSSCTSDSSCTDTSKPKCISGTCQAMPVQCTIDSQCTDPSKPKCINNICTSVISQCKNVVDECGTGGYYTANDGKSYFRYFTLDKTNPSCFKCTEQTYEVACRPDVDYSGNKCCVMDIGTGKYKLADCTGGLFDCRATLGQTACCIGSASYTSQLADNGKVCCDANGVLVTSGVGISITQAECDAKKGGSDIDIFGALKKMLGLDKFEAWLSGLGFGDLSGSIANIFLIIIVIVVIILIFKIAGGRGSGSSPQIIVVR